MELSNEQKQTVAAWIEEGAGLSEIQRRLSAEFGMALTFMDVRFLVLDLGLDVKDKPTSTQAPQADKPRAADGDAALAGEDAGFDEPAVGGVRVDVDKVVKPGSLVSGTVVFSDGVSANWALDQMGRLALDAGDPAYRPTPEDIQAFQEELRRALEKRGF